MKKTKHGIYNLVRKTMHIFHTIHVLRQRCVCRSYENKNISKARDALVRERERKRVQARGNKR
jgi:hypothetical protein